MEDNNYVKYRGRCKEYVDKAVHDDSTLTAVRGWYYCPVTNREEQHWWCERQDGRLLG